MLLASRKRLDCIRAARRDSNELRPFVAAQAEQTAHKNIDVIYFWLATEKSTCAVCTRNKEKIHFSCCYRACRLYLKLLP